MVARYMRKRKLVRVKRHGCYNANMCANSDRYAHMHRLFEDIRSVAVSPAGQSEKCVLAASMIECAFAFVYACAL